MVTTLPLSVLSVSATEVLQFGGIALLLFLVFIETGLLLGVFVPGSGSVLFTAGLFAGTQVVPVPIYFLVPIVIIACLLGDLFGYAVGWYLGPALQSRRDTWFFKKAYLQQASSFYRQHGFFAFIIGRFLPFIRTINPLLAGLTRMRLSHYLLLCLAGAFCWVTTIMVVSYVMGQQFPAIKKHAGLCMVVVLLITLLPALFRFRKLNITNSSL